MTVCIETSSVYLFNRTPSLQNQMRDVMRAPCVVVWGGGLIKTSPCVNYLLLLLLEQ